MADKGRVLTDKKLEEMEKHLSAIYSRAHKELSEKYENYILKFEAADEKKRKLLDSGKITKKQYEHWRRGQIATGAHWRNMKEQTAKQLLHVNQIAVAYVNGQLPEIYSINYNWSAKDLEMQIDNAISFELVDAQTVKDLSLAGDKSFLPYKKLDPVKDIPWNMQNINAEVLQGILQGESIPKIAKRIQNVENINRVSAIRSARTMVTGAENKGRQDSYSEADAKGIILQKEWLETSDNRTRHSHRHKPQGVGGEIVDQDQPFSNGLMFPGDPNGEPSEVYNCRCTLTAIVKGFKKTR